VHADKRLFGRGNAGVANNLRSMACFVAGRYRDRSEFARKAIMKAPTSPLPIGPSSSIVRAVVSAGSGGVTQ
jgi:hypothetical protein